MVVRARETGRRFLQVGRKNHKYAVRRRGEATGRERWPPEEEGLTHMSPPWQGSREGHRKSSQPESSSGDSVLSTATDHSRSRTCHTTSWSLVSAAPQEPSTRRSPHSQVPGSEFPNIRRPVSQWLHSVKASTLMETECIP